MKKNFKFASIALVALLASCNGSTITKDKATEVAKGITKYQADNASDLYKDGIHLVLNSKTTEGKDYTTTKTEFWVNEGSHFLHMVSVTEQSEEGKTSSNKTEAYFGQIDSKFYSINAVEKKYVEYNSLSVFEIAYKTACTAAMAVFNVYASGTALEANIATDTNEDNPFIYKSKGEGHLYIESNESEKDEEKNTSEKGRSVYIFDNYRFVSLSINLEEVEEDIKTITVGSIKVDYKVSAKMPSLNGLTKNN